MLNSRYLPVLTCLALATAAGISFSGRATEAKPLNNTTATITTAQALPLPNQVASKTVKVFFPKQTWSRQDFTYVDAVNRQTSSSGVAQFAVSQLIAGPTNQERQQGYLAPVNLKGTSNCGQDFKLAITSGVARLQFCKQVVSNGVGDDARARNSINATLKQFSTVNSVVVLDSNGNCLGDQSGSNLCLRRAAN